MSLSTKDTYVKHNLGKILIFCIFFSMIHGADFKYSMHIDKPNPYVKESVLLTVNVNQTNHDVVLLFDFDLLKSDAYTFQRIDIKESDAYHNAQIEYTYLIYPLKEGKIELGFHLTQKATTDESIAYSFSGDRDNVKTLQTTDTKIEIPPLPLTVKALPENVEIVGNFTLDYTVKTKKAQAYEPLPMQVTIQGLGYPPILETLLPKDDSFTRFLEPPIVTTNASKDGFHSKVVYPMALSHDKSFTLDAVNIQAFDPATEKHYTLSMPSQTFTIAPVDRTELLDKVDTPALYDMDLEWIKDLLSYVIIFGAGFLSAQVLKWKRIATTKRQHPMITKIDHTKTVKELLQLLLANNPKMFPKTINTLEAVLYKNESASLHTLKNKAIQELK
jgi:hypothetical protein